MPKRSDINKVLVIGSGPIIIGQAAEFDYAGTQACRALKEEGIEVVLVNSNPATIMTDEEMADRVYIEPLTRDFLEEIIFTERPQGLLATLGGQVGLNLAKELAESGVLEKAGVKLLGTSLNAIIKAEDREMFKDLLKEINEPIPESGIAENYEEARNLAEKIGYPLIIRPAYTLGGSGGGFAYNEADLREIAVKGLKYSAINQILIERSVKGWKEIEFEVMRDAKDFCIAICDMENVDAVGVHTGDSIVVAPNQTLSTEEYELLKKASFNIIRALGIEGGCNVQFALNPEKLEYVVIEVNPRVSRSSALASKATGFPIAKVTAKIALGYHLDELPNRVNGKTLATYRSDICYTVVKIPRWPFDKFQGANRKLGSQMKATGEVMAIGSSFQMALQKGIRSLELGIKDLLSPEFTTIKKEELEERLSKPDDERLFLIGEAFNRGYTVEKVHGLTEITRFFLIKIRELVQWEKEILPKNFFNQKILLEAKELGFSDRQIAQVWGVTEREVTEFREQVNLKPVYKVVPVYSDLEKTAPYYYSSFNEQDETLLDNSQEKVLVLGSGPIRIGQGIEFDYCSVHCSWSLRKAGYKSIIINNNPETVSTDFDTSDSLYFEPMTPEDVLNVIKNEKPLGVIAQFGGQTAINLAKPLKDAGVKILGTQVEDIDAAEDREKFDGILEELKIPRPAGKTARTALEAEEIAQKLGFPVLVRPSYVLGGRAMEIVYSLAELKEYLTNAVKISPDHPVLVDRYLVGKEVEVDAISDGEDVLIPGIMEHIERAGVHSGDSTAMYPSLSLSEEDKFKLVKYTKKLARALKIKGLLNIQYVIHDGEVYVIEVNPRSSRTVPYLSKVSGIPMVDLATRVILGKTLRELGYETGLVKAKKDLIAVKMPVFSFSKLIDVETSLGPEMKSTGEVLGLDKDLNKALYKALTAAGYVIPRRGKVLATIADKDKEEALPLIIGLNRLGFSIVATRGTAELLKENGLEVEQVNKIKEGSPHVVDVIKKGEIDLVINTLTRGKIPDRDGFRIRRAAVEFNVPCLTSLDLVKAVVKVLESMIRVKPLQKY